MAEGYMTQEEFLKNRHYSSVFAERGIPNVAIIDAWDIYDGERLKLVFEEKNSEWSQGVWMLTDRGIVVGDVLCPSAAIWQNAAPPEVILECHTTDGKLSVYNIWDEEDGYGQQSQGHTSGMLIEELPNGRRYRCNDYGFDTNFDKLVFRIERMNS